MKRTLHETFVANVRVLGCPRLPAHEKKLILLYAIENVINESRSLHELGQLFGTLIILGVRNAEWLNGTSHALCMAFAGSNSDVSLSDRISIMAKAHEDSVCKGNCFGKKMLCRMSQRVPANTNGYSHQLRK